MKMSKQELTRLNRIIVSLDVIAKRADAIIKEAQCQKEAIIEARAVLRASTMKPTKPRAKITTTAIGTTIGLGYLIINVIDRVTEQVEKATEKIEERLRDQKRETDELKKRYSK